MKYFLLYDTEVYVYNTYIIMDAKNDNDLIEKLEEENLIAEQPETRFNVYIKDINGNLKKRNDIVIVTGSTNEELIKIERFSQID